MAKRKFKFQLLNRQIHMYTGLIMIPYIFIFGLSAFLFNHPTFLSNRSAKTLTLNQKEDFNNLFPNLEKLAISVKDSLLLKGELFEGKLSKIAFDNTMILRNANEIADYRVKIDIPSSRVQILTLPDFVESIRKSGGNLMLNNLVSPNQLLEKFEDLLRHQNLEPGKSRVQRVPNLTFEISNNEKQYQVILNLINGNYRVNDLSKRNFKINYFLTNIHQEHGYPLKGLSVKFLWVFFADSLAILMVVWAITGFIMWYRMKRYFTLGAIMLCLSLILSFYIMVSQYNLGY